MSALDRALAAIDTEQATDIHRATARGLIRGYDLRWHTTGDRAKSVESEFRCKIYNLSNEKRISTSRVFEMGGKTDVDMIDAKNHQLWVMDHKTTSEKIGDPDATYWRQLAVEGQANMYLLARLFQGVEVAGAIWDVIKKPGIRPKKLTKADQKQITSMGTYFDHPVSEETKQHVITEGRENGELYEQRLYRECKDNQNDYFQRRPVLRLKNELVEFAAELWDLSQEVLATRNKYAKTERLPVRNCGSCMAYGRACEYLGICSGYDSPESDKWQRRKTVHSELETLTDGGHNVLTSSRLKTFQACKRKHYYRYELGIEQVDREESDALTFGSLMHKALEVWWLSFTHKTITEGATSHAATTNGSKTERRKISAIQQEIAF